MRKSWPNKLMRIEMRKKKESVLHEIIEEWGSTDN